jgi:hypothetical protein
MRLGIGGAAQEALQPRVRLRGWSAIAPGVDAGRDDARVSGARPGATSSPRAARLASAYAAQRIQAIHSVRSPGPLRVSRMIIETSWGPVQVGQIEVERNRKTLMRSDPDGDVC